jgi:hypothetical protein
MRTHAGVGKAKHAPPGFPGAWYGTMAAGVLRHPSCC